MGFNIYLANIVTIYIHEMKVLNVNNQITEHKNYSMNNVNSSDTKTHGEYLNIIRKCR